MPSLVKTVSSLPVDPFLFWQKIHPHPRFGFILHAGPGSITYLSCGEPEHVYYSDNKISVLDKIKPYLGLPHSRFPRFVGSLHFDEGRRWDKGLARLPHRSDPLRMPLSFLGDYNNVVELDFKRKKTTFYSRSGDRSRFRLVREALLNFQSMQPALHVPKRDEKIRWTVPPLGCFHPMVKNAKDAIARGDIYQANISLRMSAPFRKSPIDLFRYLSRANPSPYSCLLKINREWIVSNSPELLVNVEKGKVKTRPIAGTRPRGKSKKQDDRRRGQLLLSPKERAEHIMLVDLERNDLGRVCRPGTVRVVDRYRIERYSHVMHIVSEVHGRLENNRTSLDALKAAFPGGTITGCPKIKSIQIIEELEKVSRGHFYGSAGFFRANGDALFNILIRTALIRNRKAYIQAGAGVVADSQAKREYAEILAKAKALMDAVKRC